LIEVDGGINAETGALCAEAGADILSRVHTYLVKKTLMKG